MNAVAYRDFVRELTRSPTLESWSAISGRANLRLNTRLKRLVRNYEQRLDVSGVMIQIALGSLMLHRIVHP
jgi:hypothetical protein